MKKPVFIKRAPVRVAIKGYKGEDCTCNAIGNALNISYDLARKILQTGEFERDKGFAFYKRNPLKKAELMRVSHVKNICEALTVNSISFKEGAFASCQSTESQVSTGGEITLSEFAMSHPKGTYIVLVKGHLACVKNGAILDTWDSSDQVVNTAYEVDLKHAVKTIKDLAKHYRLLNKKHIQKGFSYVN